MKKLPILVLNLDTLDTWWQILKTFFGNCQVFVIWSPIKLHWNNPVYEKCDHGGKFGLLFVNL